MLETPQGDLRPAQATTSTASTRTASTGWLGWAPVSGIAFVVLLVVSVFADNMPDSNASGHAWTAYYASAGHRAAMLVSGLAGLLAALALLSFIVIVWTRVAAAGRHGASPLPVLAATVSAACLAVGSMLLAAVAGSMVFSSLPEPSPAILRVTANLGVPVYLIGSMFALALAVASLTLQARRAGAFGQAMTIFSLITAVLAAASAFLFPLLLAPLVWAVTVSIILIRRPYLARRA